MTRQDGHRIHPVAKLLVYTASIGLFIWLFHSGWINLWNRGAGGYNYVHERGVRFEVQLDLPWAILVGTPIGWLIGAGIVNWYSPRTTDRS